MLLFQVHAGEGAWRWTACEWGLGAGGWGALHPGCTCCRLALRRTRRRGDVVGTTQRRASLHLQLLLQHCHPLPALRLGGGCGAAAAAAAAAATMCSF